MDIELPWNGLVSSCIATWFDCIPRLYQTLDFEVVLQDEVCMRDSCLVNILYRDLDELYRKIISSRWP